MKKFWELNILIGNSHNILLDKLKKGSGGPKYKADDAWDATIAGSNLAVEGQIAREFSGRSVQSS